VQRLFLELGEIAAVAADGQEALARLDSFPNLGLVLTDFAMPALDGIELMQKIKQRRADLPVVIMTNTHPDDFTDDMSNRCLILQKPLGLDALQNLQFDLLSETYAGSRGKEE
jgi:CheY-like chemotaxis protein